jgi:cysteine desulfurase / selenocysteine lyase
VVGFGAAIEYLNGLDREAVRAHEDGLLAYATRLVADLPGVRIIGEAQAKTGVLSFVMDGIHPHDIGTVLDSEGVAIRTGQHCAQPVMDRFGIVSTARASFACYNTTADVDALVRALRKAKELLG